MPTVSIGMPVYNGENHLAAALDSLLAQTYEDFEIVVSDNGSTDLTPDIAQRYAARDRRVRYHRVETNRGATWNFNHVLALARGRYFKWSAHDDTIEPDYLRRCVEVLDDRPDVVLCQTTVQIIDDDGQPGVCFDRDDPFISDPEPHRRFHGFVLHADRCYEVFGLTRTDALRAVPALGSHAHADGVLLARLSLLGEFVELPERLLNMRIHEHQSMNVYGVYDAGGADFHAWSEWYDPELRPERQSPHWRLLWEYTRSVFITPRLSVRTRAYCVIPILAWARWHRRRLGQDARHAVRERASRVTGLLRRLIGRASIDRRR